MNEKMLTKIRVSFNGYNFIFGTENINSLRVISMGESKVFENGLIIVDNIVLKHQNWIYRGDFRFFLCDGIDKHREFEIKESINTNY